LLKIIVTVNTNGRKVNERMYTATVTNHQIKYSRGALGIKRVFDLIISLSVILLICPLLLVIAVVVKLSSPGPVFYRGLRTGLHGEPFRIFKFRTMVVDAENLGGGTTALNDFRILRYGRFLRKYKIDELPQLFNVVKGDMSLVGPRPELPQYTNQYKGEELLILSVRPGITDYSSVKFSALQEMVGTENADKTYEETILDEKNRLRIKYVKEWSFFSDIAIIFQTFYCILKKVFKQ
jgi:lipopolysaccharide/colanic/teichoic acid biosynthesis glycosyltransferase